MNHQSATTAQAAAPPRPFLDRGAGPNVNLPFVAGMVIFFALVVAYHLARRGRKGGRS